MSFTRRAFASTAAALAVRLVDAPQIARAATGPARAGSPTMLVHILLRGGLDSTLTTDPKVRQNFDPRCSLPYDESDIVSNGAVSVGPLFGALASRLPSMAILNGVIGGSVGHDSAEENIVEMRRCFPAANGPHADRRFGGFGLVGTVGTLRMGDCPVSDVRFNYSFGPAAGRSLIASGPYDGGTGLVPRLVELAQDSERRTAIDRILASELRGELVPAARLPIECIRALLARMPDALPEPAAVPALPGSSVSAERLTPWGQIWRDVLFLFQHRLTPTVFIRAPLADWDSHTSNLSRQRAAMDTFTPALDYFLAELARRQTVDGSQLTQEVGIVISSELGRFPVLNNFEGKDHFPELPVILIGPGLRCGQYGCTDERLVAQPLSAGTGKLTGGRRSFVPTIDDVGATVLHWFGVDDPGSVGYVGRRLDFLLTH